MNQNTVCIKRFDAKEVSLFAKYSSSHIKQPKSLNPKHRGNICVTIFSVRQGSGVR